MTYTVGVLVTADAKGAKAELAATATEAKKLGAATGVAGKEARSAAGGVGALGTASGAAAAKATALANAEAAAGANALEMSKKHSAAAGQVGQLATQFDNVGAKLSGQNPLQQAVQQGEQIVQSFGARGASGAVATFATGVIGMINPMNLLTTAAFAVGGAMLHWLIGSGEQVPKLEDAVDNLSQSVANFRNTASDQSLDSLADMFGVVTPEVVALQRELQDLQLRQIAIDAAAAGAALSQAFNYDGFLTTGALDLQKLFDLSLGQVAQMQFMFREIGEASTFTEQLAAIDALQSGIIAATGGVDQMDAAQLAFYQTTVDAESALRQAEAAAASIAGVDITSGISSAASEAWSLADALELAARNKAALADGRVGAGGGRGSDPRQFEKDPYWTDKFFPDAQNVPKARVSRKASSGGGRGSGGGSRATGTSEVEKQQKALDDLITREERELELLRESDPIRKELLRNREAMAGATDAERAKVEDLITTRIREKDTMESMQWVSQQTGNALVDALMGGKNAGEQLIETLKRAVLQAALLGEGPLGGLFGGKGLFGGEGLFGGIGDFFKGDGIKLATGGLVHGPGSGTSDSVRADLSNGEFVMNARSTARYRHQLEAMNSNSPVPAFANGGLVGGASSAANSGGASNMGAISFHFDLRGVQGNEEIERSVRRVVNSALTEYDRTVLPTRVKSISADPRKRN